VSSRRHGLIVLIAEAVDRGSVAVERIQKETVARPLRVLGAIPALATPAALAKSVHDVVVGSAHASIRFGARVASGMLNAILDATDGENR
jgi:hypothetical protein